MQLFILLLVASAVGANVPDFCAYKACNPATSTRSELVTFCGKENGTISSRCCIARNNTVIGLDLSNCALTTLDVMQSFPVDTQMNLELVLLDNNTIKTDNDNAFYEYVKLNYVSVPWPLTCPGANWNAWNVTTPDEKLNATVCAIQVTYCDRHSDACIELAEYPDNAYCVPKGPSLFECPCSPGVYGYKCLRRGEFPTAIFAPLVSVSTIALSVGLWYTQRRHVVASPSHPDQHQH